MKIILVEGPDEFLELLFDRLQIDVLSTLIGVRIEVVREKYTDIIETFHFIAFELVFRKIIKLLDGARKEVYSL